MMLRNQVVWARCDAAGSLVAEGGRVEIRYKPGDGKAYGAGVRNLDPAQDSTVYPDDTCGEASRAPAGAKKTAATKSKTPAGAPPTSTAPGTALAYCDGACSGNPGPCGIGAVLMVGDARLELSEFLGAGTNNIAELTAIWRVVETAPAGIPLAIYSDSTYSAGVLTKGWKAKANVELIEHVRAAIKKHGKVTLHYVKAHAGIELNERADALAVAAVTARASAGWVKPRTRPLAPEL